MPIDIIWRKFGRVYGVVFPTVVLNNVGLKAGQVMTLDTMPDGTITLKPKRKYRLSELVAQCDLNVQPPADLEFWIATRPSGQEIF